jgi:hypothetical protein
MDLLDRKRIYFSLFLIIVMACSLYLFSREAVRVDQYHCFFLNYAVIDNSSVTGMSHEYDVTCFRKNDTPEVVCYACAYKTSSLLAETQIEKYKK